MKVKWTIEGARRNRVFVERVPVPVRDPWIQDSGIKVQVFFGNEVQW